MITVAGEALIDLVVDHDGCVRARPGGGPFNTARTIGRLGLAPAFLGSLPQDRFGHLLWARLDQDGVICWRCRNWPTPAPPSPSWMSMRQVRPATASTWPAPPPAPWSIRCSRPSSRTA